MGGGLVCRTMVVDADEWQRANAFLGQCIGIQPGIEIDDVNAGFMGTGNNRCQPAGISRDNDYGIC